MFRADPRRRDEPALEILRSLADRGETWLDIGAGGGRYALPLALQVGQVIALDPSVAMLAILREGMATYGIGNVQCVEDRWPSARPYAADATLIAHVGYDVDEFAAFLDAMEQASRRLCVAMLLERQPTHAIDALWPEIHGEPRATLPALPEFLALQLGRGRLVEVRLAARQAQAFSSPDDVLAMARRQLWIRSAGPKDLRLQALLRERLVERDGRVAMSWEPLAVGVVSWPPR
jgi:SAM-dependent methyltransferase